MYRESPDDGQNVQSPPPRAALAVSDVLSMGHAAPNAHVCLSNRGRLGPAMTTARLARIELPDFGMPDEAPTIPPAVYAARLSRTRRARSRQGL